MRIEDIDMGPIIKAARLKKGITQEALAEIAEVGQRHIMAIENEGSCPSLEVLFLIVRELNIPSDLIFYPEKPLKDAQLEEIVRMLYLCDERSLKVVYGTAKATLEAQGDA